MSQSQCQLEPDYELTELQKLAADCSLKSVQFKTQLRNMMLSYLHALTQSKYKLEFYENGSLKSISPPRGWGE